MILYLWRHRESPRLGSKRWCIVWAKRALNLGALSRLLLRIWWLRRRGAALAELAIVENCLIQGPAVRLSIGAASFIGQGTQLMLHEQIRIGRCVVINRNAILLTASHDVNDPQWRMVRRRIVIDDYAWIATGAMLLPGVRIGRGAVVGAGAVVRQDVPDYAIVAGNPAVMLPKRRCERLEYNPAALAAPIEAWLGRADVGAGRNR